MKSSMTGYEIRLELLQLATQILLEKHAALGASENSSHPAPTTSPTTEEIIIEADKLNKFVSKSI